MSRKDFVTIDPAALDAVAGGRRTTTSSTSNDDRILDAIESLNKAVLELGRNQQQKSSNGMEQLLPFLMMQLMGGGLGGGGFNGGGGPGCGGGNGMGGGRY